jgi:hypothetical protein
MYKYVMSFILVFFLLIIAFNNTVAQGAVSGDKDLLTKIKAFPEEYENKRIILNDIWIWCKAEKVLKSDYYSILLYMPNNEFNTISSNDSNIDSVMIKKLAKKIINNKSLDSENTKYLANVYGKIKKNVYWFSEYTFIVDKIEFKTWSGSVSETIE